MSRSKKGECTMIRRLTQLYRKCKKEVCFRLFMFELEGADSLTEVIVLAKKALCRYRKGDLTTQQLAQIRDLVIQQCRTKFADTVQTKANRLSSLFGQIFGGGENHDK